MVKSDGSSSEGRCNRASIGTTSYTRPSSGVNTYLYPGVLSILLPVLFCKDENPKFAVSLGSKFSSASTRCKSPISAIYCNEMHSLWCLEDRVALLDQHSVRLPSQLSAVLQIFFRPRLFHDEVFVSRDLGDT